MSDEWWHEADHTDGPSPLDADPLTVYSVVFEMSHCPQHVLILANGLAVTAWGDDTMLKTPTGMSAEHVRETLIDSEGITGIEEIDFEESIYSQELDGTIYCTEHPSDDEWKGDGP